jgi:hypothetical protein
LVRVGERYRQRKMQACHAQMMYLVAEYAIVAGRRRIKIKWSGQSCTFSKLVGMGKFGRKSTYTSFEMSSTMITRRWSTKKTRKPFPRRIWCGAERERAEGEGLFFYDTKAGRPKLRHTKPVGGVVGK